MNKTYTVRNENTGVETEIVGYSAAVAFAQELGVPATVRNAHRTLLRLTEEDCIRLRKMYLTADEAKAANLPSADEQIRRWNELQAQIRGGR